MSFLAPLYLVLAGAAAVPLLLHVLRRNVGARVDFPAARYLQRAEQEHSRSLRLRNLLLMLLRVLLVLVLALAAARPFARGVGVGHGPTALAVVLDNSLSTTAVTAGAPVFDALRNAAAALLRDATPGDRLWLVTADGRVRGGSRETLLAELPRVAPIEGSGDLALALRRAAAAAEGVPLPARIVAVATDGQQSAWSRAMRVRTPVAILVPPGDPPANRAVLAAAAEPARWTPRGRLVAQVDAADSAAVRVLLGEHTIARGVAGRGAPLVVSLAPAERGWQAGRVELAPDDFPADDRRWFAVWIGAPPAVAADPSAGPFVASAIATLAADGRVAQGVGVRIASADSVAGLPALILPPTDPLRLPAANRALARLGVGWHFGALERRGGLARGGRLGARLDGVAVSERWTLARDSAASADTIATVAGEPWIVGAAGWVLVGSRLDPAATALPVRAPFVPWLADMLELRLGAPAGDLGVPLQAAPGERVRLPAGADALELEGGARRTVTADTTYAPDERGVWFILHRGRRIGALVVNAPPDESRLARWPAATLAGRLGGRDARAAESSDAWRRAVFASSVSRPALVPLLVVAFLLMVAEALLVRSTRGRRASPTSRTIAV